MAELPPASYPNQNCQLCIDSMTLNGCTWPCYCTSGSCCAFVSTGGLKPARDPEDQTTSVSAVSAAVHADLKVIPNPNKGAFTLSGNIIGVSNGNMVMEITDVLGKVIYKDVLTVEKGKVSKPVSLGNNIAKGVYLIRIKSDEVS